MGKEFEIELDTRELDTFRRQFLQFQVSTFTSFCMCVILTTLRSLRIVRKRLFSSSVLKQAR